MFNLKENTTPDLYYYIVSNSLEFRVTDNMRNFAFIDNFNGRIYDDFADMFAWCDTPQGSVFWVDHNINLNKFIRRGGSFKFLKDYV